MKNIKNTIRNIFITIVSLVILHIGPAQAEQSANHDEWKFTGAIYLWAPDLKIDTNNGAPDLEIPLSTVIDNFDVGLTGSFEARKDKWLVFTDLTYLNMSDDQTSTATNSTSYKLDMRGWALNLAGGYNLLTKKQSQLDVIGGVRYFDLRIDASGNYFDGSTNIPFSIYSYGYMMDGIVGVKGRQALTNNWYIPYYVDIGAGGTDLTWQVMAGINYRAANWVDISLMYRHIYWDLSPGTNAFEGKVDNITFSGPVFGAVFRF